MNKNIINPELTFEILKQKAEDFVSGKLKQDQLNEWGKTINVRTSISMEEKKLIMVSLITQHMYTNTEIKEQVICELYRNCFFYLYIGGYLGINIGPEDVTFDNYDLMEPIYGPWIESFAARDINTVKNMIKDSLELYNINRINNALESVDTKRIEEAVKENSKLVDTLQNDPELISKIRDIAAFNNPLISK